jgi:BCD family chlorophyll transporter-like MFS transporter
MRTVWLHHGARFLPFADVATEDVPLSRLLRLSLFQVSVGMSLVLLVGTLNRVMIVELGVSAMLVSLMIALPVLFAPFRALVGFRSDTHRCELGWRRVPFVWRGTLLQFGGFAIMPFALLVLAGRGHADAAPFWLGQGSAALAFLLVGAGLHTVQTAGLALATDLTPVRSHPRVVGLMYVVLLVGMSLSALAFGTALTDFTPGRLVQVLQAAAILTLALNAAAVWKQEPRRRMRGLEPGERDPTFSESWEQFTRGSQAVRHLVIVGLGTMAFAMSDVLLEPFGGQILGLTVSATTKLTALLALGGLLGFAHASRVLGRGADANRLTVQGAAVGVPAFLLVVLSGPLEITAFFLVGNFLVGFGGAVFGHATLTVTMDRAPEEQVGLALGAWGAVQATAAGAAMGLSGSIRDVVDMTVGALGSATAALGPGVGYTTVYVLELLLLAVTIAAALPLLRSGAGDTPEARPTATSDEGPTSSPPPSAEPVAVPPAGD